MMLSLSCLAWGGTWGSPLPLPSPPHGVVPLVGAQLFSPVIPRGFTPCREGLGSSEGLGDPQLSSAQLSPALQAQAAPEAAGPVTHSHTHIHSLTARLAQRVLCRTGPAPPAGLLPPLSPLSPGPEAHREPPGEGGCSKPPAGHRDAGGEGCAIITTGGLKSQIPFASLSHPFPPPLLELKCQNPRSDASGGGWC